MTDITIDASPENIHWGYLDASLAPIRTINSGDTVILQTLPAALKEDLPPDRSWLTEDHKKALADVPLGGPNGLFVNGPVGPHMLTGPVYVKGAMPGDVLQVDILEIRLKQDWGFSAILPNLGTLPEEFTNYQRSHTQIDINEGMGYCAWGSEVDLDPFFGIMAVAPPAEWGAVGTPEPRAFGGNMDNKDLRAGTTLYLPVFNEGALFSAGDGHGKQGNGEVCITALETALTGKFRLTVRKDFSVTMPYAETEDWYMTMGFNMNLEEAAKQALRQMISLVEQKSSMSRDDIYMLLSMSADLHVTQLVDINKGIHMIFKKKYLPQK